MVFQSLKKKTVGAKCVKSITSVKHSWLAYDHLALIFHHNKFGTRYSWCVTGHQPIKEELSRQTTAELASSTPPTLHGQARWCSALQCFDRKTCLAMSLHSAERSFWNCPELVEKLLPFLDPKSTARLARSHQKTLNILQGSFVWGKLIQRGCPKGAPVYPGVKCLMEILQMMEDPETVLRLQQNLLDLICERFPAPSCLHNDPMTCHCNERVILSCAKHSGGHVVTPPVFLLLEIIEAAFGTNYQKIEAISVKLVGDLELSALVARVPRQKKKKVTLFSAQNHRIGVK